MLKVTQGLIIFTILHVIWAVWVSENNKAECMLSVLVNTNLLRAPKINVKNIFFHQVLVFIMHPNKMILLSKD